MELTRAFIILLDISGYTKFVRLHKVSLIHAEKIITELLESVIDASDHPLVLNKLQGDAALFYALSDGSEAMARDILQQVVKFFAAFGERERELVSECGLCVCDACARVGQLKLKAVVHHGEVALKRIKQFEEIAGEEVILAHRLLKNSIKANEYILLTTPYFQLSGGLADHEPEDRIEKCEGIGLVDVIVYYPHEGTQGSDSGLQRGKSLGAKLKMIFKLESYFLKRLFSRPSRVFKDLK